MQIALISFIAGGCGGLRHQGLHFYSVGVGQAVRLSRRDTWDRKKHDPAPTGAGARLLLACRQTGFIGRIEIASPPLADRNDNPVFISVSKSV